MGQRRLGGVDALLVSLTTRDRAARWYSIVPIGTPVRRTRRRVPQACWLRKQVHRRDRLAVPMLGSGPNKDASLLRSRRVSRVTIRSSRAGMTRIRPREPAVATATSGVAAPFAGSSMAAPSQPSGRQSAARTAAACSPTPVVTTSPASRSWPRPSPYYPRVRRVSRIKANMAR